MDDSEKIAFIKSYIENCSSDVGVIADNLPDDAPYFSQIPFFFEKLDQVTKDNDHVKYFIAYDYLFGIYRKKDVLAGYAMMRSMSGKRVRKVVKEIQSVRCPEDLSIMCIGDVCSGKSSFLTGKLDCTPGMCGEGRWNYSRNGTTYKLDVIDSSACGRWMNITCTIARGVECFAILYDPTEGKIQSSIERWYEFARDINEYAGICVVQSKCDLKVDTEKVAGAIRWCNSHGIPHIQVSAAQGIGYDEFREVVTCQTITGIVRKAFSASKKQ